MQETHLKKARKKARKKHAAFFALLVHKINSVIQYSVFFVSNKSAYQNYTLYIIYILYSI